MIRSIDFSSRYPEGNRIFDTELDEVRTQAQAQVQDFDMTMYHSNQSNTLKQMFLLINLTSFVSLFLRLRGRISQ